MSNTQDAVISRKPDRRVIYTKLALREALIELMANQHISGISVKSICEQADINRSTFYLHYKDQYDLLHQIETEVLDGVRERLVEARSAINDDSAPLDSGGERPITLEAMTHILEYARENASVARVLLSENCDFTFKKDIMELTHLVTLLPDKGMDRRMREYIITYAIDGCVSLAEKWLEEGMKEPPKEFAQLMLQVLYYGTSSFIPSA